MANIEIVRSTEPKSLLVSHFESCGIGGTSGCGAMETSWDPEGVYPDGNTEPNSPLGHHVLCSKGPVACLTDHAVQSTSSVERLDQLFSHQKYSQNIFEEALPQASSPRRLKLARTGSNYSCAIEYSSSYTTPVSQVQTSPIGDETRVQPPSHGRAAPTGPVKSAQVNGSTSIDDISSTSWDEKSCSSRDISLTTSSAIPSPHFSEPNDVPQTHLDILLNGRWSPDGSNVSSEEQTAELSGLSIGGMVDADMASHNDDRFSVNGDNDDGYESDRDSSASASITSSVLEFAYENGRRYHKFREGQYNFPNDISEQEREDMKHAMISLLCRQLHFAPLDGSPQEILDMGTGTGIWAIEMGDTFPSANVLGVDLSPIQPDWVPANVRFMVDDVESSWLHSKNHFDYIHSRHTVMAIKDWPRLMQNCYDHLKPGGWLELQEIHHIPMSANGTDLSNHPVHKYWTNVSTGLSNLGVDFEFSGNGRIADLMRQSGYVNVTERVFQVPLGLWPENRLLQRVGLFWKTILLNGVQAIALGPYTRGLGWSTEAVEAFLMSVRRGYHDDTAQLYMPFVCAFGQKPPLTRHDVLDTP